MKIENEIKLDYNDVLIKPKRSRLESRASVDLTREYKFLHSKKTIDRKFNVGIPLIAANMDTVATMQMAEELAKHDCWTALHKFYSVAELERFFKTSEAAAKCFYTTGIKKEDFEKLSMLSGLGTPINYICIDVANGHTQQFVEKCRQARDLFPEAVIMAGNVVGAEMVQELLIVGLVDVVKTGIGGGSGCSTRHTTGVGMPQLTATIEAADAAHGIGGHICSDGGCRLPADIVKSIAAGADFVMVGGMLAGHDECGGTFRTDATGKKLSMVFYGMSSQMAMDKHYGGKANYRASEGKVIEVPYKGKVENTIQQILGGLRSACTYVGASKLKDLSKCTTFVRVNRVHDDMRV